MKWLNSVKLLQGKPVHTTQFLHRFHLHKNVILRHHCNLSQAYYKANEKELAFIHGCKSVEKDLTYAKGYLRMGIAAFDLKCFEEATVALHAFTTNPEFINDEGLNKYYKMIKICHEKKLYSSGNETKKCYKILSKWLNQHKLIYEALLNDK